ncbi:MAG: DNA polymerase elongation subunit, partial [Halobacteriales archaeon]
MDQRSLADYEGGDRPDEEAVAVAGNGGADARIVDPDRANVPDATGTVELAVMQVDYTVVGNGPSEEPIIHVFGRTPDEDLEHVRVRGFDPYFYVPTEDVDEEELAAEERITGFEHGYESIRGDPVTKIKGRTPRDVGQIR